MKKLRLLIPVLLICFMLNGCGFLFPFFYLSFPAPVQQEEIVEELPTSADVDPKLSADDIYWRSKFAAQGRALDYSVQVCIEMAFTDNTLNIWPDLHYNTHTTLDPDTNGVNIQVLLSWGSDEPEEYWEYYRDEDGRLICYYHDVQTGECTREEIPLDGMTPYVCILEHTVYGYPYTPQDLSVEPQTRILNDREVYVVTFVEPAGDCLGYTGNPDIDQQLERRSVPCTWYVDAKTFHPVRREYHLSQFDDLLGDLILSQYGLTDAEAPTAISGFSLIIDYHAFDSVTLEPIPEEVLKKAWENAGFSAS